MVIQKYKLTYGNIRGRGEPIRFIFHQAGVNFEDVRLDFQKEWPSLKPKTPMGQMPVLEVDGKMMCQSVAIARFLAKEFKLAGKNAWEQQALADMIVDGVQDCRNAGKAVWSAKFSGDSKQEAVAWKEFKENALKTFMENYTKLLGQNKTGWFVGDSVTWADIFVADFVWTLASMDSTVLDPYPLMKQHQKKVLALPKIAAYVAKRPQSKF